jgi:hypothetical protein
MSNMRYLLDLVDCSKHKAIMTFYRNAPMAGQIIVGKKCADGKDYTQCFEYNNVEEAIALVCACYNEDMTETITFVTIPGTNSFWVN